MGSVASVVVLEVVVVVVVVVVLFFLNDLVTSYCSGRTVCQLVRLCAFGQGGKCVTHSAPTKEVKLSQQEQG